MGSSPPIHNSDVIMEIKMSLTRRKTYGSCRRDGSDAEGDMRMGGGGMEAHIPTGLGHNGPHLAEWLF